MRLAGHLQAMAEAIAPFDTIENRARYAARDIPRGDLVNDIDKRYRWDLYYASGYNRSLWDEEDLSDAHIDTALRRIVPPITLEN